jgi:hypothetical protein
MRGRRGEGRPYLLCFRASQLAGRRNVLCAGGVGTFTMLLAGSGLRVASQEGITVLRRLVRSGLQVVARLAAFPSAAKAHGLGARDRDGSCSMTKPLLHEVDRLASSGTLSF